MRKRRLAIALIALGIALIVAGTLYVSSAGYGTAPITRAQRKGYDEVKVDVQRSFFTGLVIALSGLALAIAGGKLLPKDETPA